ncbi:hypothetical protein GCM10027035_10860 [Emticicia sediminis]
MKFLDNKDFSILESKLGFNLPQHYKDFHQQEHEIISKMKPPYFDGENYIEDDDGLELSTSINFLIDENVHGLNLPKNQGFGKDMFVIGSDGFGNLFLINVKNSNDTTIYFLDHESSISEYCKKYKIENFDMNKDDINWFDDDLVLCGNLYEFAEKYTN